MLSSLLVCDNTRSMSSSKTSQFDSKICHKDTSSKAATTTMEQTVIKVMQEVVRRIVGLDAPAAGLQFDRVYQIVVTVYKKYKTQLDQLVNVLMLTDLATTAQSFDRVLDSLFVDGQINCGRVAAVLAFAGCVAEHCIKKEIILSGDVDELAEVMGRQLASRLISSHYSLEEFARFASQSSFFEELPWRSIAFTVFGLGALAVFFSIQ